MTQVRKAWTSRLPLDREKDATKEIKACLEIPYQESDAQRAEVDATHS